MGVLYLNLREVADGLFRRAAAPEQAGVFAGDNPAAYNTNDPIQLWVIQLVVVVGVTQLLGLALGRIRQPRVIAEVIGGVILGPSIMGRIPKFTNTIFPALSLPMFNLTANIGLVLFLFLVGMELDLRVLKRNARASAFISLAGLVIPLGLGAALAVPIYHQFVDPSVNFGYFVLFVAVAIGITAFPVLCRILTELKLLDTTVGVVTLSAGVGNDIIGWVLLALTVALVNAGNRLNALWIVLTAIGYVLFLVFPVRLVLRFLASKTGSLENGHPTKLVMTFILVLVFISAFFTDIIGIHPIFGGFLAGLIIPKDNGFAIAVVEKLEDLVSIVFLPLYFVSSGLKTNLGLLNNGVTWGYTILICTVAFFSKFLSCAITAKLTGFNLRESGAIGALMSCKGLVELIVLNVGLSAGILDTRTFSMFVLHALVLTFMTTPLTILLYPARVRVHVGVPQTTPQQRKERPPAEHGSISYDTFKSKFTVILDKMEEIPAVMTLTQLLQSTLPATLGKSVTRSSVDEEKEKDGSSPASLSYTPSPSAPEISVDAVRLIELTDRTSAVLKSQHADTLIHTDPILSVIRTFGYLNRIAVSTALSVVGFEEFPSFITNHVRDSGSQMLILPWSNTSSFAEEAASSDAGPSASPNHTSSPFESIFGQSKPSVREHTSAVVHTQFIRNVFSSTPADVALFVDRGLPQFSGSQYSQHIFLPFFGGPDDRLALTFVAQLCMNPSTTASVVRFSKTDSDELSPYNTIEEAKLQNAITTIHHSVLPDTVYGNQNTQTRLQSETADNLIWSQYSNRSVPELSEALGRIQFSREASAHPLHAVIDAASTTISNTTGSRVLVVVGRSRRMAVESHVAELRKLFTDRGLSGGSELPKTLGDVGAAFVVSNSSTSLLVVQAAH